MDALVLVRMSACFVFAPLCLLVFPGSRRMVVARADRVPGRSKNARPTRAASLLSTPPPEYVYFNFCMCKGGAIGCEYESSGKIREGPSRLRKDLRC